MHFFLDTISKNLAKRCLFVNQIALPVLLVYIIIHIINLTVLDIGNYGLNVIYLIPDILLQILFAYILYNFSKQYLIFLLTQSIFMCWFYIGCAIKLYILSRPISPYDIYSIKAFLLILSKTQLLIFFTPIILALILFVYNFKLSINKSLKSFIFVSMFLIIVSISPNTILRTMDFCYGNFSYFQKDNYERRGPLIHLLQESLRFFADHKDIPTHKMVHSSVEMLKNITSDEGATKSNINDRNIYFIIVESLFDPLQFKKFTFSSDPIDKDFRNLWESSKYSTALSPVYAGETAQSEFELLTGIPSVILGEEFILFEYGINSKIPSLPKTLKNIGYSTIAFHANVGEFWNRQNAYLKLGITNHHFIDNFNLDDLDGPYLSDKSFFNQVFDKLKDEERPYFAHILSISVHYPYPLNQELRPYHISVHPHNIILEKYVNSLYYTTNALFAFIKNIQSIDPAGLIMISSDHMPYLGPNIDSAFDNEDSFDQLSYEYMRHRIPLIIIDGSDYNFYDDINLYEIPSTILNLLNIEQPNIMKLFHSNSKYRIRYLDGLAKNLIIYNNSDKVLYTNEQKHSPLYKEFESIYLLHKIIIKDLFIGNQYSLNCIESNCISPNR